MQNIILLHAVSCFFLTGLIWTIQLLHYPSFKWIQKENFSAFTQFHSLRVSIVVIPFMITELITGGILLMMPAPLLTSRSVLMLNLAGVFVIWLSTFLLSVPCHSKLGKGFSGKAISRLVVTNWPRTVIWTLRSVLWFWIIKGSLLA